MAKTFGYVDNLTAIFKSGLLTGKQINALSTPSFYTSSNSYSSFVKALILNNSSLSAQAIKDLDAAHYRVLAAELAKSPSASDHFIYFLNASSSAQVGILTTAQFEGAGTAVQTWLLTNRYKDLSSAVIRVLTKGQLGILIGGKPLYQQLSPAQVGILTATQFKGADTKAQTWLLTNRYKDLSSAVIRVLTKGQLGILIGGKPLYQQLSPAQVGILTATQFKGADTKAQTWLLTNRYKDLSSAVIRVLTKGQLGILIGGKPLYEQLSPAQVGILTTTQFKGADPKAQTWLLTNRYADLSSAVVSSLTIDQFRDAGAATQKLLLTHRYADLSSAVVSSLTADQFKSTDPIAQTWLLNHRYAQLSPDVVASITADQFISLDSEDKKNWLLENRYHALSAEVVGMISMDQFQHQNDNTQKRLLFHRYADLGSAVVSSLTADQFDDAGTTAQTWLLTNRYADLGSAVVSSLTADQFQDAGTATQELLLTNRYKDISLGVLSSLTAAQFEGADPIAQTWLLTHRYADLGSAVVSSLTAAQFEGADPIAQTWLLKNRYHALSAEAMGSVSYTRFKALFELENEQALIWFLDNSYSRLSAPEAASLTADQFDDAGNTAQTWLLTNRYADLSSAVVSLISVAQFEKLDVTAQDYFINSNYQNLIANVTASLTFIRLHTVRFWIINKYCANISEAVINVLNNDELQTEINGQPLYKQFSDAQVGYLRANQFASKNGTVQGWLLKNRYHALSAEAKSSVSYTRFKALLELDNGQALIWFLDNNYSRLSAPEVDSLTVTQFKGADPIAQTWLLTHRYADLSSAVVSSLTAAQFQSADPIAQTWLLTHRCGSIRAAVVATLNNEQIMTVVKNVFFNLTVAITSDQFISLDSEDKKWLLNHRYAQLSPDVVASITADQFISLDSEDKKNWLLHNRYTNLSQDVVASITAEQFRGVNRTIQDWLLTNHSTNLSSDIVASITAEQFGRLDSEDKNWLLKNRYKYLNLHVIFTLTKNQLITPINDKLLYQELSDAQAGALEQTSFKRLDLEAQTWLLTNRYADLSSAVVSSLTIDQFQHQNDNTQKLLLTHRYADLSSAVVSLLTADQFDDAGAATQKHLLTYRYAADLSSAVVSSLTADQFEGAGTATQERLLFHRYADLGSAVVSSLTADQFDDAGTTAQTWLLNHRYAQLSPDVVASITADQFISLDSEDKKNWLLTNRYKHISAAVVSLLTADQFDDAGTTAQTWLLINRYKHISAAAASLISAAQFEGLDAIAQTWLLTNRYATISAAAASLISAAQFEGLEAIAQTGLLKNRYHALSAEVMSSISYERFKESFELKNEQALIWFLNNNCSRLSASEAASLTAAQFQGLSDATQKLLLTNRYADLSPEVIGVLTKDQLQTEINGQPLHEKLSAHQEGGITGNQFWYVDKETQDWFLTNYYATISAEVVGTIFIDQFQRQNEKTQIQLLTHRYADLSLGVLSSLTADQFRGADPKAQTWLLTNRYKDISLGVLSSLTTAQFQGTDPKAQSWLLTNRYGHIRSAAASLISAAQFEKLDAIAQTWLLTNHYATIRAEVVGTISIAQFQGQNEKTQTQLLTKRYAHLSPAVISVLTHIPFWILQQFSAAQVGGISCNWFQGVKITTQTWFLTNRYAAISAAIVSSLTAAQFKGAGTVAKDYFINSKYQNLSPGVVASLTADQFDDAGTIAQDFLLTNRYGELSRAVIGVLTKDQLKTEINGKPLYEQLKTSQVGGLTTAQFQSADPISQTWLLTHRYKDLSTAVIGVLTKGHLETSIDGKPLYEELNPSQVGGLTTAQFQSADPIAQTWFLTNRYAAISAAIVSSLTIDQFQGLSDATQKLLLTNRYADLSPEVIGVLTKDQLQTEINGQPLYEKLSAHQVGGITGNQFRSQHDSIQAWFFTNRSASLSVEVAEAPTQIHLEPPTQIHLEPPTQAPLETSVDGNKPLYKKSNTHFVVVWNVNSLDSFQRFSSEEQKYAIQYQHETLRPEVIGVLTSDQLEIETIYWTYRLNDGGPLYQQLTAAQEDGLTIDQFMGVSVAAQTWLLTHRYKDLSSAVIGVLTKGQLETSIDGKPLYQQLSDAQVGILTAAQFSEADPKAQAWLLTNRYRELSRAVIGVLTKDQLKTEINGKPLYQQLTAHQVGGITGNQFSEVDSIAQTWLLTYCYEDLSTAVMASLTVAQFYSYQHGTQKFLLTYCADKLSAAVVASITATLFKGQDGATQKQLLIYLYTSLRGEVVASLTATQFSEADPKAQAWLLTNRYTNLSADVVASLTTAQFGMATTAAQTWLLTNRYKDLSAAVIGRLTKGQLETSIDGKPLYQQLSPAQAGGLIYSQFWFAGKEIQTWLLTHRYKDLSSAVIGALTKGQLETSIDGKPLYQQLSDAQVGILTAAQFSEADPKAQAWLLTNCYTNLSSAVVSSLTIDQFGMATTAAQTWLLTHRYADLSSAVVSSLTATQFGMATTAAQYWLLQRMYTQLDSEILETFPLAIQFKSDLAEYEAWSKKPGSSAMWFPTASPVVQTFLLANVWLDDYTISLLTATQFQRQNPAIQTWLLTNRYKHISAAVVSSLTADQFDDAGTAVQTWLLTNRYTNLSADVVASLTTAQFEGAGTAVQTWLLTHRYKDLSSAVIGVLTKGQLETSIDGKPLYQQLSDAQVGILTAAQFSEADPKAQAWLLTNCYTNLSADVVASLTTAQFDMATTAAQTWLLTHRYKDLSAAAIGALTNDQLEASTSIDGKPLYQRLSDVQVGGISGAQFVMASATPQDQLLTKRYINYLSPAVIGALTKGQLETSIDGKPLYQQLSDAQVGILTAAQFSEADPKAQTWLLNSNYQNLSPDVVASLTAAQFQGLSDATQKLLLTNRYADLSPEVICVLTKDQLQTEINGQPLYEKLSAHQVGGLIGEQLGFTFSTRPLYQQLSATQVGGLTAAQFQGADTTVQTWLVNENLTNLSAAVVGSVTAAQFQAEVISTQNSLLSRPETLVHLSPSIIASLSEAQLEVIIEHSLFHRLSGWQIGALSTAQVTFAFQEFKDSQIQDLTCDQLASIIALDGEVISVTSLFSNTQISLLNFAQLTTEVLASLSNSQIKNISKATVANMDYDVLKNSITVDGYRVLNVLSEEQLSAVNSLESLKKKHAEGDLDALMAGAICLGNEDLDILQSGLMPTNALSSSAFYIDESQPQVTFGDTDLKLLGGGGSAKMGDMVKVPANVKGTTFNATIYSIMFRYIQYTRDGNLPAAVKEPANNYVRIFMGDFFAILNAQRNVFNPLRNREQLDHDVNIALSVSAYVKVLATIWRWSPHFALSSLASGTPGYATVANRQYSAARAIFDMAEIGMKVAVLVQKTRSGGLDSEDEKVAFAASLQLITGQLIIACANILRAGGSAMFSKLAPHALASGIGALISLAGNITAMAIAPKQWDKQAIIGLSFNLATIGAGVAEAVYLYRASSEAFVVTATAKAVAQLQKSQIALQATVADKFADLAIAVRNFATIKTEVESLGRALAAAKSSNIALSADDMAKLLALARKAPQASKDLKLALAAVDGAENQLAAVKAGAQSSKIALGISVAIGVIIAANPIPYMQAQSYIDQAEMLAQTAEDYRDHGNKVGYREAKSLSAFYQRVGKIAYSQASIGSTLAVAGSLALLGGPPGMLLGLALTLAGVIYDTCMNDAIQAERTELGKKQGSGQALAGRDLRGQFDSMINPLIDGAIKKRQDNIAEGKPSINQIALFGGATISQVGALLGITATDSSGNNLFSQMGGASSDNFSAVLTENANTKVEKNLFQDFVIGTAQQNVDLSTFIDTSFVKSENNICITHIEFVSPLTIASSQINQADVKTSKNQSTVQYLSNYVTGATFNLASDAITNNQAVVIDTNNILTNYIPGDFKNNSPITMNNIMTLGNAQYYINASVANFTYENAKDNSGFGSATLDYNNITSEGSSIFMIAGTSNMKVNKKLSDKITYWQENNGGLVSGSYGKETASAQYIQLVAKQNIDKDKLENAYDVIAANTCVTQILAVKGSGNILSGYGGMTLEAGHAGSYYFNKNSAGYNNGKEFTYRSSNVNAVAQIDIIQGSKPKIENNNTSPPVLKTPLTAPDQIILGNVLNLNNIIFSLSTNNSDLTIINTETRLAIKVYNFLDNAENEIIKIQSRNFVQVIQGGELRSRLIDAVSNGYINSAKFAKEIGGGNSVVAKRIYEESNQMPTMIRNNVVGWKSISLSSNFHGLESLGDNITTNLYRGQNKFNQSISVNGGSFDANPIFDLSYCGNDVENQSAIINFTEGGRAGAVIKKQKYLNAEKIVGTDTFQNISQFFGPNVDTVYNNIQGNVDIAVNSLTTNTFNIGAYYYDNSGNKINSLAKDDTIYNTTLTLDIISDTPVRASMDAGVEINTINASLTEGLVHAAINQFGHMVVQSFAENSRWTLQLDNFYDITNSSITDTYVYKSIRIADPLTASPLNNYLTAANLAQLAAAQASFQATDSGMNIFTVAQNFNVHSFMTANN
ncbi:hypothetical protein [Polynucleobacter sp. AM-25C3]|uniref:hypothetical protein n=1 Tax=Polynucleobacter sp. AM-25C3 TaxID=1855569 RepID=UPI001C0AC1B3|nr:hypothetical protein [Polynucleobacter sp. AM-25C3]MBU3602154.1 hypothetical protein [Polynucleobacter sp. AM-25C3]